MSPALSESIRKELRQTLGSNVANQLLKAIDDMANAFADISELQKQEARHTATVESLIQSHMKLQRQLDGLQLELNAMRDPPPVSPPVDLTEPNPPAAAPSAAAGVGDIQL